MNMVAKPNSISIMLYLRLFAQYTRADLAVCGSRQGMAHNAYSGAGNQVAAGNTNDIISGAAATILPRHDSYPHAIGYISANRAGFTAPIKTSRHTAMPLPARLHYPCCCLSPAPTLLAAGLNEQKLAPGWECRVTSDRDDIWLKTLYKETAAIRFPYRPADRWRKSASLKGKKPRALLATSPYGRLCRSAKCNGAWRQKNWCANCPAYLPWLDLPGSAGSGLWRQWLRPAR